VDLEIRTSYAERFAENGVVIVEYLFSPGELLALDAAFEAHPIAGAGARSARLGQNFIASIRRNQTLQRLADELSGATASLVRMVAFDKTPETNWFVPWHQDRSIAVRERSESSGFANWTVKDGVPHTEPPLALLESMVTLRLHLDDCDENNGPLEVVPGSHILGRLDRQGVDRTVTQGPHKLCLAARGDVLAMRPLLVHRSQRAKQPNARRVLHLDYAATSLPPGLTWAL
jgi:Phytanoyl-CoA dioxygenase (PhyH)